MLKKEIITILILTVGLFYFAYFNAKKDFPIIYQIILVICYIGIILYRVIKIIKLKK